MDIGPVTYYNNLMEVTTERLRDHVKEIIVHYQEDNSASLKSISALTPASYTTVREIVNGTLKSLSIKKAFEISSTLGGPKTLNEFFKKVSNEEQGENRYSHLQNCSLLEKDLDGLFEKKDFSKIIWAAFGNGNITRDEVLYRWGKEGENNLDYLINAKILLECEGVITGCEDAVAPTLLSTYKQLGLGYSLYDIRNSMNQENWVSFQTNSVNLNFIKEFRSELQGLFSKFLTKSSNKKYHGDIRIFLGMVMDRYMNENNEQREKIQ